MRKLIETLNYIVYLQIYDFNYQNKCAKNSISSLLPTAKDLNKISITVDHRKRLFKIKVMIFCRL